MQQLPIAKRPRRGSTAAQAAAATSNADGSTTTTETDGTTVVVSADGGEVTTTTPDGIVTDTTTDADGGTTTVVKGADGSAAPAPQAVQPVPDTRAALQKQVGLDIESFATCTSLTHIHARRYLNKTA
jgi:hypothetical protein